MAIKYNGQDLQKRIINGREVEKVMYNGSQLRPESTPPVVDNYLCFTADYYNTIIRLDRNNNPASVNLEISTNGSIWTDYDFGDITLSSVGDKVYFRNKSTTTTGFSSNSSNYVFYTSEEVDVSGDVTYLINKNGTTELTHYDCFSGLFSGSKIRTAPELPATSLSPGCYRGMFSGCTHLVSAPELPATDIEYSCYYSMFSGCTSLINPPSVLPFLYANLLCCYRMFSGCTSLTTAPEMYAVSLGDSCFEYMFSGCTSLTTVPVLLATSLSRECYAGMFSGCTSLTTVPELPATTLADYCYTAMFYGCTSLTSLPELPAVNLRESCYANMFYGCTNIKLSTTQIGDYQTEYRIPVEGTGISGSWDLDDMFTDTGGSFTGTPTINTTYYTSNSVVNVVDYFNLTKESWEEYGFSIKSTGNPTPIQLEISFDKINWADYTIGSTVSFSGRYKVFIRNKSNVVTGFSTSSGNYYFEVSDVAYYGIGVGGDISYLLCKNGTSSVSDYCFYGLFRGVKLHNFPKLLATTLAPHCYEEMFQGSYIHAMPELPAITLANSCYKRMFADSNIEGDSTFTLPAMVLFAHCYEGMFANSNIWDIVLPATTLADYCYASMFEGAIYIVETPSLPATTLAPHCYESMFSGCYNLSSIPSLPATTLADYCYARMFQDCSSLTSAPSLPATTLAPHCYEEMFINSFQLSTVQSLPATTLAPHCYESMFSGCYNLSSIPSLPATTLADYCYARMFESSSVMLSDVQGGDYQTPYRIPSSGTGTAGTSSLDDMFYLTGGDWEGTPNINQTYYTSNTVI